MTTGAAAEPPIFMVERYLPEVAYPAFAEAARRTASVAAAMTDEGVQVCHLGSVYLPDEECSFCCFQARDAEAVRELNRRVGVPFWRVVPAVVIER